MEIENLSSWLEQVIAGFVSHPADIEIERKDDEQGSLYTVSVNKEDRGKVIGKGGAIADALRVILRSAGQSCGIRTSMKVDAGTPFEPNRSEES